MGSTHEILTRPIIEAVWTESLAQSIAGEFVNVQRKV
jgi:hypothetical protein